MRSSSNALSLASTSEKLGSNHRAGCPAELKREGPAELAGPSLDVCRAHYGFSAAAFSRCAMLLVKTTPTTTRPDSVKISLSDHPMAPA